jgi:hypothetical protein
MMIGAVIIDLVILKHKQHHLNAPWWEIQSITEGHPLLRVFRSCVLPCHPIVSQSWPEHNLLYFFNLYFRFRENTCKYLYHGNGFWHWNTKTSLNVNNDTNGTFSFQVLWKALTKIHSFSFSLIDIAWTPGISIWSAPHMYLATRDCMVRCCA